MAVPLRNFLSQTIECYKCCSRFVDGNTRMNIIDPKILSKRLLAKLMRKVRVYTARTVMNHVVDQSSSSKTLNSQ